MQKSPATLPQGPEAVAQAETLRTGETASTGQRAGDLALSRAVGTPVQRVDPRGVVQRELTGDLKTEVEYLEALPGGPDEGARVRAQSALKSLPQSADPADRSRVGRLVSKFSRGKDSGSAKAAEPAKAKSWEWTASQQETARVLFKAQQVVFDAATRLGALQVQQGMVSMPVESDAPDAPLITIPMLTYAPDSPGLAM